MISTELEAEWHPTLNLPLIFDILLPRTEKYWWVGKTCGHEWAASMASRKIGSGCPICANQKILVGYNDLGTTHPLLASEWHPTKNGRLTPEQVFAGNTRKKIWWRGKCGHEWENSVSNRAGKNQGCPVCVGRKVLQGFNDLASQYPDLSLEWHPTKNRHLTPEEIYMTSYRKVWWRCKLDHEWSISPSNRIVRTSGCPICSNKQVLVGFNDLITTHPQVAAEWHPTKNGHLTPQEVTAGSNRKIWWIDSLSHEWHTSVSKRTVEGQNCPICSGNKVLAGYNDLGTTHPLLASEWHPTKNGTATPAQVSAGSNSQYWWRCRLNHDWKATPTARTALCSGCPVCAGQKLLTGFNDLATVKPLLASEWHPTKNNKLSAGDVFPSSLQMVWWLGACGHEWETPVLNRSSGAGCHVCSGALVVEGINDLSSKYPKIAAEWHPTKNGTIVPSECYFNSSRKFWWRGTCNHEWEAPIGRRTVGEQGCKRCSKQVSRAEGQIKGFIESFGWVVEGSNRKILGNKKEIDLWIPQKKTGVEFNGIYWHTESRGKGMDYHQAKWLAARKAGIRLIQVWEDDWTQRRELVKRMLTDQLGVFKDEPRIKRETEVITITETRAEEFLNRNHLQGSASGSYYLGLVDTKDIEKLLAVMVLQEESGVSGKALNIVRYATAVSGGTFTKLFSYAEDAYNPHSFLTFVDNCNGDGEVYERHGFRSEEALPPDYMYVVRNERKDKSEYSVERFKDDPTLLWEEGLTERELADLNGLDRIWDAGKTRYRLTLS